MHSPVSPVSRENVEKFRANKRGIRGVYRESERFRKTMGVPGTRRTGGSRETMIVRGLGEPKDSG